MIAARIKDAYQQGFRAGYEQRDRELAGVAPGKYVCTHCKMESYPNYGRCAFCGGKNNTEGNNGGINE